MMNTLFLILIVFGVGIQSIAKKAHNERTKGSAFSYSAACSLVSSLIFIATLNGKFEYSSELLLYSVLFALSFSTAALFGFLAIATGPLSLCSLITGYSLIIPTLYGLIVLHEPVKISLLIGLSFLVISLFLINQKKEDSQELKKINLKWVIYVTLSFLGNGLCSTVQKAQQIRFEGGYKSEFMIVALAITVIVLFIAALINERKNLASNLKKGAPWFCIAGLANGGVNLGVMVLSASIPASVMFPVISAGSIALAALVSLFVYKEKLCIRQWIGMILGLCAIVVLNL